MTPSNRSAISRRQFLGTSASVAAAAAAVTIVPRHVLGGPKAVAPSEKVNIAIIGNGGQGRTNTRALFKEDDAQIIAVCDPAEETNLDPFYYKGKGGRGPVKGEVEKHYSEKTPNYKVAEFSDFRELLDKNKDIDAVLIATPDHNHALVTISAMKAGKHVYCEKPLTHNVWEARQVARVTKETGAATQMGNHGHSSESIRQTCEWIWDGAIGKIHEVHAWSDAGGWVHHTGRPKDTPPVPANFNWDIWLGTRPQREYSPEYHPYNWRGWWSFGGGCIGDMACHNIDPAVWALGLAHPETIEATGALLDSEVVCPGAMYTYTFGPRTVQAVDKQIEMPAVKLTWYDGGLRPPTPAGVHNDDPKERLGEGGNGILFVGEKGMITCPGWGGAPRILPRSLHSAYKSPTKTIPRVKGHHADWLQAIKGGKPASGNFEYSARLTEIVLLGNVALRSKKKLEWDGENMKAKNTDVQKFLKEEYRKGWELPV